MKDLENQGVQFPSSLYLEKFFTLGLMTNRIAHEINNSIQGILLGLNFLEMNYSQDENITLLNQEVHKIKRLIQAILKLARTNRTDFELIDLTALIRETITLAQDLTGDQAFSGIIDRYSLSSPLVIKGNFLALQLVLLNLFLFCGHRWLKNNRSLSPIEIKTSTDTSARMHTIQIQFPGQLALNEASISSIGEADEAIAEFGLVKRILHQHQGTFQTLEGSEGKSSFMITLPVAGC